MVELDIILMAIDQTLRVSVLLQEFFAPIIEGYVTTPEVKMITHEFPVLMLRGYLSMLDFAVLIVED